MSNTAERAYHHGDLKQSVIDAACAWLLDHSAESLSLRALARELGVSPTAPYRHFESKNALFAAIATQGFRQMKASCELVLDTLPAATTLPERICELGLAYVGWAIANPEKYQLFFDSSLLDFNEYEELQQAGEACFEVLQGLVDAGLAAELLIDRPAAQIAGTLWAQIHGLSSLLQNLGTRPPESLDPEVGVHRAMVSLGNDPRDTVNLMVRGICR